MTRPHSHAHAHAHGHGFQHFGVPTPPEGPFPPFWNIVESVANAATDFENHPFFAGGRGEHRKGGKFRHRQETVDGISVSPRSHKWGFRVDNTGVTTQDDDSVVSPLVDVYDTPDSYIIIASVPGASPSNVEIDFDSTEHELIINGVLSTSISDEHRQKYLKIGERRVGKFERKVKFPAEPVVDDENIKAKYSNGVLKVTLPKVEPVQPEKRHIPISIEEDEEEEQQQPTDEKSSTTSPVGIEEDSVIVETPDEKTD